MQIKTFDMQIKTFDMQIKIRFIVDHANRTFLVLRVTENTLTRKKV